jgi:hypothetical protein
MKSVEDYNNLVLNILSNFLNYREKAIQGTDINTLVNKYNITYDYAYSLLLCSLYNIDTQSDEGKKLFNDYFLKIIKGQNSSNYINNEYYRNIKLSNTKSENWQIKTSHYSAYEGFVFNDIIKNFDGKILPQVGYFKEDFYYPCIEQNGRLWMSITPNEINTMAKPIEKAKGNILCFGLGLGYYAYMVSIKKEVNSIVIIEKDKNVIDLFNKFILPQFKTNKIKIINIDAFDYIKSKVNENFDYAFVDLWHDIQDGLPIYEEFKKYEKNFKNTIFDYWIEDSMKVYIKKD